jgi:DNA-binding response OmpR family regulator
MTGKPYDEVVLDPMMVDGSGEDVLRTMGSMRPNVKCVVVISGMSAADIDGVDEANVQAKLRKPFDIAELIAAIRSCVIT